MVYPFPFVLSASRLPALVNTWPTHLLAVGGRRAANAEHDGATRYADETEGRLPSRQQFLASSFPSEAPPPPGLMAESWLYQIYLITRSNRAERLLFTNSKRFDAIRPTTAEPVLSILSSPVPTQPSSEFRSVPTRTCFLPQPPALSGRFLLIFRFGGVAGNAG